MSAKREDLNAPKRKRKPKGAKKEKAPSKQSFPIVGIGASAGGLEAFERFFLHLPSDTGMAFIVIQHLEPTSDGLLPELLQRYTKMSVVTAKNGEKIQSNTVYVIPPNHDLSVENATLLVLEARTPRGIPMPIDFFLRHLAEDQHNNAYCIILSGTGTDGTLGVKAIKEHLGLVLVQDPIDATFDGMPQSAIDTGLVDYIGSAEELARKLVIYASSAVSEQVSVTPPDQTVAIIQQILGVLRSRTGHNFAGLKQNMLIRRIQRRSDILELPTLPQYLAYLQQNDAEAQLLYKELLIGVTNFFRDSEAWEALKKAIKSELLKRPLARSLRVWDVGCATGEEAYSLAMTLEEAIDEMAPEHRPEFQIFATDIDADSIDVARQGLYYPNIALDVNAERLARFFTKENANYHIKKSIRERIVFAVQDVVRDPPFTRLDILVCRNLLIYFTLELQQKLIPLFHYSLGAGGILFLGSSESVGKFEDYFSTLNSKWKLFTNRPEFGEPHAEVPYPLRLPETLQQRGPERSEYFPTLRDTIQHVLLDAYAPAAIVVNKDGDIIYFFGKTGKYLEPVTGKASLNVQTLAREALRFGIGNAIYRVSRTEEEVLLKDLSIHEDDTTFSFDIRVRRLDQPPAVRDLLLVTFEEHAKLPQAPQSKTPRREEAEYKAAHAAEMRELRERVQSSTEETETSREEFKSTMEELQSTNEELQSTNEELKTSREELQSVNEELITVNTELKQKNEDLVQANSDMQHLLDSTEIATLFLDTKLHILRFTSSVMPILNLIASDAGRPLSDISTNLVDSSLTDDIRRAIQTSSRHETEMKTKDGAWYDVRIVPYRATHDGAAAGVVVTFSDITSQHALVVELQQEANTLERGGDSIVVYDLDGVVTFWNSGAEKLYGWPKGDILGKNINEVLESVFPLPFDEIKGMLLDSRAWTGRIKRRRHDGTYITSACQLLLRHDEDNKPVSIMEICNGR